MKPKQLPEIRATSGTLSALREKLDKEPCFHVFITVTSGRRVPLSGVRAEISRLNGAVRRGRLVIREGQLFTAEAAK